MAHRDLNRMFSTTLPGFIRFIGWIGVWVIGPLLWAGCGVDRSFIFFPDRTIVATPESVGLSYENIFFQTADGVRLNGWFIPGPDPSKMMIYFHGNGGNIGHRVEKLRLIHDELGLSVFVFDYRQYGQSGGSVTEEGTYRDAQAALAYLRSRSNLLANRIIYFGESLGGAVAVDLALKDPPRALIMESPFTSIRDMAKAKLPYLPVGFLIHDKYDSLSKIQKIHVPLLILHGDRDGVVPFDQGRRLFEAANPPKVFYTIPGADHNDAFIAGGQPYWDAWKRFLDRLE
jgi:fermentation-respiration switch protein FrsA (DUF1100 family)